MKPLEVIEAHASELRALGVQCLGVFGSYARGDERPDSNVDLYLEFAPGMKTYDNFYAVHELLEALLDRPIDLVTDGALRERKRRLILPTVRYAALDR